MADSDTDKHYKAAFMERVKASREAIHWKQWQMAEALGIPQDQYKQYETRGMLPHRFVWPFCMFARVNPQWLLTGKGTRAVPEPPPVKPDIEPSPRVPAKKPGRRATG